MVFSHFPLASIFWKDSRHALIIGQCVGGVAKQVSVMLTYIVQYLLQASSSDSRPLEGPRRGKVKFASGGTKYGGTKVLCSVLSCTFSRRESQAGGNGSALG